MQLVQAAEAVATLATNRAIKPVHVSKVTTDLEARKVLEAIIRRWTEFESPTYATRGALAPGETKVHKEHVVPCRVLIDRMIMNPAECGELLRTCVVLARVTTHEHNQLGGIYMNHAALYERMLVSPLEQLPTLGLERYTASGLHVDEIGS